MHLTLINVGSRWVGFGCWVGLGSLKEVFNINTFFQAKAEAEAKKFPVKHLKKKVPIEVLNEF